MSLLQALADITALQTTVAALQAQSNTNTSNITILQNNVAAEQIDITILNGQNTAQQEQIDSMQSYSNECSSCGQTDQLHDTYVCTNCGYNRNRNCIAVCRVCNFRNTELTTDVTRRECVKCHVAYKLEQFTEAATQCKQCDVIFQNYRSATKYYLDF